MIEKYIVGELSGAGGHQDIVIEGWADAMDWAEEYSGQFDEQFFIGIWDEKSRNLFAIYDGNDWFTK